MDDHMKIEAKSAELNRTLEQSWDHLQETVLQVKRERDELLAACRLVLARLQDGTILWRGQIDRMLAEVQQVQRAIYRAEEALDAQRA